MEDNNIAVISYNKPNVEEATDFETAISLTGYGKFNYLLMLVALPAGWTSIFSTSTMSYILPSAECDLSLTNLDKGILNAITYAGMISSAFLWGFLSDTLGRQKLLVVGFLLDGLSGLASSFSQSFAVLLVLRFLSGFIISGPHAVLLSYLAEFHGAQYRARMIMVTGVYAALANISLPGLAWLLIPQPWSWTLFGGSFTYNSWRIFVAVCALPSLVSCGLICFFDESPKFLMSRGRHDEALQVLRKVYSINTASPMDTYPVKYLVEEKVRPSCEKPSARHPMNLLKLGWRQARPILKAPYASRALLVFVLQFGCLLSMNTIRLWLPQLFFIMEDFDKMQHEATDGSLDELTLCGMLGHVSSLDTPLNSSLALPLEKEECSVNVVKSAMYLNSVIVGCTTGVFYIFAGTLINAVGRKTLMISSFVISGTCGCAIYWSQNTNLTLALVSIFVALSSVCGKTIISVVVDIFPTTLRAMAVSLTMMCGRVGALLGNLVFPLLLDVSCELPFFLVSGIMIVCSGLSFLVRVSFAKALD